MLQPTVTLYTRRRCGLCDEAALELRALAHELGFALEEVDVDARQDVRRQYDEIVPVVAVGGRVIAHAPIAPGELRAAIPAALA